MPLTIWCDEVTGKSRGRLATCQMAIGFGSKALQGKDGTRTCLVGLLVSKTKPE
jgi:hypothetical protein